MSYNAVTAIRKRLEDIPTQIIAWAWGDSSPGSTFEEVLQRAEKYRDYRERDSATQWPMNWQPFLNSDQTRIIFDALSEYETAIEHDAVVLRSLREWFGPEC